MASMVFDGAGEWLANQRWFGAKDHTVDRIDPTNIWQVSSPEEHPTWLVTVDLFAAEEPLGTVTLLTTRCDATDPDRIGEIDHIPVAEVSTRPGAILVLLRAILDHRALPGGLRTGLMNSLKSLPLQQAKALGGEQSNSTFEVDGLVAVKLNRTFEDGPDPEFELGRELTLANTRGVVPLLGAVVGPRMEGIATVNALVIGTTNGWAAALDSLTSKSEVLPPERFHALGTMLKRIHEDLDQRFPLYGQGVEPIGWAEKILEEFQETKAALEAIGHHDFSGMTRHRDYVLNHLPSRAEPVQRVHGDLHLGQTLLEEDGSWWILDFAGEPTRTREVKQAPKGRMQDLAGLTRSIAYAQATSVRNGVDTDLAAQWATEARHQLLAGYGVSQRDREWLQVHELSRHLYEVRYELANRPDWVDIPLAGFAEDPAKWVANDEEGRHAGTKASLDEMPGAVPLVTSQVTTQIVAKSKPTNGRSESYAIDFDPAGIMAEGHVATSTPALVTDAPAQEADESTLSTDKAGEETANGANEALEDGLLDKPTKAETTHDAWEVKTELAGAEADEPASPLADQAKPRLAALTEKSSATSTDQKSDSAAESDTINQTDPDQEGAMTASSSHSNADGTPAPDPVFSVADRLADGVLATPHDLLGAHHTDKGWVQRVWRPDATAVTYQFTPEAPAQPAEEIRPGLFESPAQPEQPDPGQARWNVSYGDDTFTLVDAYAFEPSIGELDTHLWGEGRHEQAWTILGANRKTMHGINGVAFAVWAPNAKAVRVIGDFNSWDGRLNPMRTLGSSGIWELFIPDVPDGALYKYELITAEGRLVTRADPFAKWTESPPGQASRVFTSRGVDTSSPNWSPSNQPHADRLSIYEVHLGSWRYYDGRPLTYTELVKELVPYVKDLGFTHVEFLPVAEHPYAPSWGYQVTGQFAPTSRFGTPDEFRTLVKAFHDAGIGVIVDWVPAHFPKDEWALARFDGTHLYEHADPRQGEHPDWGTLVFNFGRNEVRNFLYASALYWLEEMGVDGLRVDAVASMLYLDYSREEGEWVPNAYGGRENLEAVQFLQEVNATVYKHNPHALMIAEESTSWDGVSRPTDSGGLGFGFKWNMGWMHDTLQYMEHETVHRKWHHGELTFGLVYAWSENFILPLSHDEVVHGKQALLAKMPGDDWQKFANLRALYAWMWGHPGKQLLFMGSEFAQWREWASERELDWGCMAAEPHIGVHRLVTDLNKVQTNYPALYQRDNIPEGFTWLIGDDSDANILAFARHGEDGEAPIVVVANFSPVPRHDFPIPLPHDGLWKEILNTDATIYGGSGVGNQGRVNGGAEGFNGQPASTRMSVPPLGVIFLTPETD